MIFYRTRGVIPCRGPYAQAGVVFQADGRLDGFVVKGLQSVLVAAAGFPVIDAAVPDQAASVIGDLPPVLQV